MKKLTLFLASLFVYIAMFAQTQMSGEYTVGTGGTYDYASMADAGMAIKSAEFTGDVTLLICTDLTETINTGIVNKSEYTLTIRPDKDENRTITYTTETDNTGPTGVFVIGGDMTKTPGSTIGWASVPTKNVVVDGAAEGKTTPRLKITNGKWGTNVLLYGDAQDVVIKNCIIVSTTGTASANYALTFRSENHSKTSKNIGPKNCLIENCVLESTHSSKSQTVYFQGNQANSAAGYPSNITIRNCNIKGHTRGMFLYGVNGLNVEGCTFDMLDMASGLMCHGILGNNTKGVINVKGNKFIKNSTKNTYAGEYGLQTITASGGATVWVIENNYFAGYNAVASGTTTIESRLVGIRCGDSCVIRHNTFYMPKLTYAPGTALVGTHATTLLWLAGTKQYPVQNNIFVCEETTAHVSLIRGALNPNVTGNVFYHNGGNAAIVAGAPSCMAFTDLETSYPAQAATSKWTNVTFTDAANGDLSLAGSSDGDLNLAIARLADVLTDINGKSRAEQTYVGAYEGSAFTTPVVNYTVTVTAENGTVTGAGEYEEGKEATLIATPADGYKFVNWTKGEEVVSTENPYTFVVTADVALVANFAAVEPEPVVMTGIVKRALQNGENVIVLTHEADGTPHIYNIVKGEAYEVSQEGVVPVDPANEYDYLSISDIALTDDGKLVACNYIRCAAADPSVGTTRYYIWNDLAGAPALWFTSYKTGNSTLGDVGYTFAVKGVSTNAQVMTTAVHNNNRAARINLHTVVNGVEETSKYHRFGLHTTDSYFTEAKRGVQFQLSTTPLDGIWAMDGDLANPAGFTVPSDVNAGYVGIELPAEVVLGKKYNGASYVTCLLKELMVAPYADAEGKLAGVKVIDITAGFATAKVIKEANLDAPVAATAAATAVSIAENVLTVTLVADAEVHTLTVELDTKAETHTITATANSAERGYIEGLENEGIYEAGSEVTLRAVANDGYEFVDWNNGSTDNPLTFVVRKNETLVANFRPALASTITLNALPVQDYSTSIVGTIKRAIQNGENTIVLTHEADGTPHIYNVAHATKTVTEISQEGVVARDPDNVGDYLSISDIALTDDGKLVACNYIRCQNTDAQVDAGYKRGTNRFYIWDELTGAAKEWFTEQFAGNSYRADAGYTMALKGSSTDCNILVTVRHYNAAGAGGSDGSVRMHYFTIAGGEKTSRIYLGWTIEPTAPYYTHTIGENMLLSSSPIATMNFIMDANLTVPSEFQVIGDAKDVTILGRIAADSVSAKYNGVSCLPNYNEHHLLLTPYANEEGNLAGVKVLDIVDGIATATKLTTDTDLATAENATAAAATAVVDAEGNLTIHLFADAKVYTFTQKEQTDGPATAIDNTIVAPQVEKIIRNGQVLIIRDGKTYNMMGQEVK